MRLWKRLSDRRADKMQRQLEAERRWLLDQEIIAGAEKAVVSTRRRRRAEEERQGRIGQGRDHFRSRVLGYRCQRGLPMVTYVPDMTDEEDLVAEPVFGRLEQLTARQRRRLRHKFNSRRVTGELEGVVLEDLFRG